MGVALPKMANYPGGFSHGITIRGIPLTVSHPGEVFWVDENASCTGRGTFKNPDVTIESCMSRCVADRGDIIMVKPGHIENIAAAGTLTCDIADVAIVGLGSGSNKAQIVWDTADTADVDVTAANVSIVNMMLMGNFLNVTAAFGVAAGGDYFTIEGCTVRNTSVILNLANLVTLAVGANEFAFIGNDVYLDSTTAPTSLVATVGESTGMRVMNNNIIMEASESIFDLDATAITGAPLFKDNVMVNLTGAADFCVEIDATTVATFVGERYACASGVVPVADPSASFFSDCEGSDTAALSSLKFPAASTAW